MSDPQQRFDEAVSAAREQRGRLRERLGLTRARLKPMRIAEDAKEAVEDSAKSTLDEVKAHPVRTGLTVAGVLVWVFRDPLLRHAPNTIRHIYSRLAGYSPEDADETLPPDHLQ